MPEFSALQILGASAVFVIAAAAGGHAAMWKRSARSAFAWIAFILLLPLFGALAYWFFGINRIERKAGRLYEDHEPSSLPPANFRVDRESLETQTQRELARFVDRFVAAPIQSGNRLEIYRGGDAFAEMLEAIDGAERSLTLLTYIFDHDPVGLRFLEALRRAVERGIQVRVLIDAAGDRYTRPLMHERLRKAGVNARVFNRTLLPRSVFYSNLRNHRKLLIADGRIAFTGGMNIRHGHAVEQNPPHPVHDVHFRLEGPVVAPLQNVFADDWRFTSGETLDGEDFFPPLEPVGDIKARIIEDGPAESFNHLRWTLLAGLACARERVRIQTPYFLPDQGLITALNMAARRGVQVEILLPERSNLKLVQWASTALLWQVLEAGCRIHLVPPPFDHSKLMVVDGAWSLVGSANWDPRSLRLNFELNVELYCREAAARLDAILDEKLVRCREITTEEVDARRWWIRLRDGVARLASPYL